MIRDPDRRGRTLADFYRTVAPRLFHDLEASGVLPAGGGEGAREHRQAEWECFALYACVRGLVAAGGFNRETASAIDALHERVVEQWNAQGATAEAAAARRALISERYAEYGAIGQAGGASGAGTVTRRLGEAAARHMLMEQAPPGGLAELAGELHESLAEGAAESVRQAE
jgi:hypothetical protein